ncbi:MAG TPA: substrate-binding domain-containing protein [Thermoanaerobaculia bacterium]|nr:substrate-binding domain-containing protein [Thermoanaerobaculia bacterium]
MAPLRALALSSVLVVALVADAAEIVRVYGPGGPAPAMKEAAKAFQKQTGIRVEVIAGPTDQWIRKARKDADVIFSGSENMMTSFIRTMDGAILEETVRPIYIRPATILVRPGNPKQIAGVRDLLQPGARVMVVEGAGQIGLWEDIAGRLGDINAIRTLRSNIVHFAKNSGEAKERWTKDTSIEAWLIYNIWEVANPGIADQVEIEPELRIWRDCGIALTRRGGGKAAAKDFASFLESSAGRAIFERWGWK